MLWKTELSVSQWFSKVAPQHFSALFLWILMLVVFWQPLTGLVSLSFYDDRSSHIIVIPLLSAFFIGFRRAHIFSNVAYCPTLGVPLLFTGLVLWYSLQGSLSSLPVLDRLSFAGSVIVLEWVAVFILCYGTTSFKAASFPLLFLVLMIPIPTAVIERAVFFLQKGSAEISYLLFRLIGIPIVRQDFRFSLPGVDIEVAEQCSSIRSSLSLLITSLIAGNLFLQSIGNRILLSLLTIPIAVFKNAIRIVTISWLGIYVTPEFFHGSLHRNGGLPFSLVALALLGLALFLFRRPLSTPYTSRGTNEPGHS